MNIRKSESRLCWTPDNTWNQVGLSTESPHITWPISSRSGNLSTLLWHSHSMMMAAGVLILGGLQRHGRGRAEVPLPHAVKCRLVALHGQCGAEDTCCQSTFNKDSSAEPLRYTPGPNRPTPPPFSSYFSPIQPPSPILLAALKDKGGSVMGGVLCPSPPSGAECLCQDIRLYKVMKDVIKVTACWSAACSIPALCRSWTPDMYKWRIMGSSEVGFSCVLWTYPLLLIYCVPPL